MNMQVTSSRTDQDPVLIRLPAFENENECASFAIRRSYVGGPPVTGDVEIVSDPNTGPRTVFGSFSYGNIDNVDSWGLNNKMNWDFGSAKLTSVTGYRELDRKVGGDNGSPYIVSDTLRYQNIYLLHAGTAACVPAR